ncbi:MAG: protein translocase SEC61 complex subunit gamma [Candidatus Micrarchaeota archaeon]|nr:protein translocase SEC61 complex subunit gamma [Candidatus Micrarchaeota archaeon]
MADIGAFIKQSVRVLNVASRPRQKEYEKIVKITGAGIILIGLVGALISFIMSLLEAA